MVQKGQEYIEVINFIKKIDKYPFPDRLTNETQINDYIDGDDAVEFLEEFSQTFNIDMSDFKFERYFLPESKCNWFYTLFFAIFNREKLTFQPLTIKDLVEAVEKRKWIEKDNV